MFSHVSSAPGLYVPFRNEKLSVRYLTNTSDNPSIPVSFRAGAEGVYELNFNFDGSKFEKILLEDSKTNYSQNLKENSRYRFNSSVNDKESRFIIHFSGSESQSDEDFPVSVIKQYDQLVIDLTLIPQETEQTGLNQAQSDVD